MICPKCQKENPDSQAYCGSCGFSLNHPAQKESPKKTNSKGNIVAIICILIAIGFFIILILPTVALFGTPEVHLSELHGTPNPLTGEFIFKYQVYNSGNGKATNVYTTISLKDKSGNTIASKQVFVGNIDPGQTIPITATLPYSGSYSNIEYSVSIPPDWLK